MHDAWWIRPLLLLILVASGIGAALILGIPSVEEIHAWVSGAGWAAPILFVAVYAALTLTPTPATLTSITAGVLFGLPLGVAVIMTGAVTGAAVGFALARVLGRDAVRSIDNRQLQRLDGLLRRRGLLAVIGLRLVPVVPFVALNYACGLSALRTRDYLLGTTVGILPSATAYATLGAFGGTPGSAPFLVAVAGLAVLTVAGIGVIRRHARVNPARP